ncbi:hypothetical protein O3M35_002936 [Rhynocoris fuscipes]|uniref:Uncharacterized protein n=1 Tax=Rhynocoris fuscipes TaxID=488301 RepID=A0AAW1CNG0_9HEMI
MKVLIILLLLTLVQLNQAQSAFESLLTKVKHDVTDSQKKVQEKIAIREQNLPKFATGTFGDLASKLIDRTKGATAALTSGVRDTASELTRALISTTMNTGFSLLLAEYKLISDTTGIGRTLTLPDVATSAYGFEVKATGGYFSSIASLEKYGSINVTIEDAQTVILDVPVRFNEMKVGYNSLSVSAFLISTSGSFSVNVGKNSILIQLKLGLDSTCALSVEKVQITELDDIKVTLEGLGGYASMLTEKLTNYIISWIKGNIARYIQEEVDKNLKAALGHNKFICTNFLPTS